MKKILVLFLISMFLVVPAFGAMAVETKVSGKAYLQYTTSDNTSAFDVGRAYITVQSKINEKVRANVTTDVKRFSDLGKSGIQSSSLEVGSSSLNGYIGVYLKFAYLEIADALPGASLLLGQHGLPWIVFSDKVWGYRYVAKSFSDEEGKLTSTDLGIGLKGALAGKNLEYAVSLVNGEGYNAAESNLERDTEARVTFKGIPGVGFSAGYRYRSGSSARSRLLGLLSYENKLFSLAGEYLSGDDAGVSSSGISVYGGFKLPNDRVLFGRYSSFDPNTVTASNSHTRTVLGIENKIAEGVKMAFDYQGVNPDTGSAQSRAAAYAVHLEVNY